MSTRFTIAKRLSSDRALRDSLVAAAERIRKGERRGDPIPKSDGDTAFRIPIKPTERPTPTPAPPAAGTGSPNTCANASTETNAQASQVTIAAAASSPRHQPVPTPCWQEACAKGQEIRLNAG